MMQNVTIEAVIKEEAARMEKRREKEERMKQRTVRLDEGDKQQQRLHQRSGDTLVVDRNFLSTSAPTHSSSSPHHQISPNKNNNKNSYEPHRRRSTSGNMKSHRSPQKVQLVPFCLLQPDLALVVGVYQDVATCSRSTSRS